MNAPVSSFGTTSGPSQPAPRAVPGIMRQVMLALIPGTVLQLWLIGPRLAFLLPVAIISALLFEALALRLRGKPVMPALSDGSIIVAAWLLTLCLPPSLPTGQLLIGVFVMVMLGKHLYGGFGHNPFNPAMVAYALVLVSFPVNMTHWPTSVAPASATERLESSDTTGTARLSNDSVYRQWDAISGATPLDTLRQIRLQQSSEALPPPGSSTRSADSPLVPSPPVESAKADDFQSLAYSVILGSDWLWVNLAWLAGGLYLLWQRVIRWQIPVSVLTGFSLSCLVLQLAGPAHALPLIPALLSGAIMLGAFFIATDPVSAATSGKARLIYGLGVGILCVVIRQFSSYPEGVAFAILLMNMTVPLLDYWLTGPAGQNRRGT